MKMEYKLIELVKKGFILYKATRTTAYTERKTP